MSRAPFVTPATLDEAEARHSALVSKTQDIDVQLAQPGAAAGLGWRSSALCARRYKIDEVRQLKAWMKAQRRHTHALTVGAGGNHSDPHVAMLSRAYRLLKTWASEIDQIDPAEQATVDEIMLYLQRTVDPAVSAPAASMGE